MDLYNMLLAQKLSGGGGGDTPTLIDKTISANGTYNASSDNADGYKKVVVDVSNSYDSGDEGKVVSNGALVAQTSATKTENGTYDTTLNDEIIVNVPSVTPTGNINITSTAQTDVSAYATAQVVDADLVAENIKKDVDILGVVGTYEGGGGSDAEDGIIERTISGTYINNRVSYIGTGAFQSCSSLTEVSFPNVKSVGDSAFYDCLKLSVVSIPNLSTVGIYTFARCSSLMSAIFPEVTNIEQYAFYNCRLLTFVSIPNVISIGSQAFAGTALSIANFPNAVKVYPYAFYSCSSLTEVSFPNVTNISQYAFGSCSALTEVSFPNTKSIGQSAFRGCKSLMNAYFLASSMASLYNVGVFSETPMANSTYTGSFGSIYVPASLVDSYKSAFGWSNYSDRITSYVE